MKDFTVGKEIRYVDGDYNDCINRWEIKRAAKRIFPKGTEMRKIKVTYLGRWDNGFDKYNIYKVVSAEGVTKYVGMNYNSYDGGFYYEMKEE